MTSRRRAPFAEPIPAVGWGTFESHRLTTRDGQELGAWFVAGREDAPSVLLLHGNGGSRGNSLTRAEVLAQAGCSVMLLSLRSHGDSTGDYNDIGYSARHDVVAAIDFLETRRPGKPLIVQGTSMGAAAGVFAAGELGRRVQGYILESPYRDLRVAVRNRTENALPPVLDWVAYQGLLTVSRLVLPHLDAISPEASIGGVPEEVPVLILAGGNDRLARPDEARALLERVKSHGALVLFKRAGHLKFLESDAARYRETIQEFVHRIEEGGDRGSIRIRPGP